MPGRPRGMPIVRNIRSSPAPSKRADSMMAFGMVAKKCLMTNTGNAENMPGRMMAGSVSLMPSAFSTR